MECPNCGDNARDDYALFCSTCGNRLILAKNRFGIQIAAGVIIIVASSMTAAMGVLSFMPYLLSFSVRPLTFYGIISIISIFAIFAFLFGLASGIFILRSKRFNLSLLGISLVLASSFIELSFSMITNMAVMVLGASILTLSVLALIFTALSRKEFI